jgi:ubiquinone/menaquinone biosynthesis C-methylase UbiE
MMQFFTRVTWLLALLCWTISACRNTEPTDTSAHSPALLREKPTPATTISDEYHPSSEGNFGGLVDDFESKQRAIWQKPDLVISQLGDLTGKTVADIGAGTGYFTFRLVPKAQKVIGIDIDQRFISFMDSIKVRLPEQYRNRFETRLADPNDSRLHPEEADAVIIVNTYGYLQDRVAYLTRLAKGIKPNGDLLIIDFKKNNLPVGPSEEFKISTRQVEQELLAAGFKVKRIDLQALDYQYIMLASKL